MAYKWGGKNWRPVGSDNKPKINIEDLLKPLSEKSRKGNIWGAEIMNVEKTSGPVSTPTPTPTITPTITPTSSIPAPTPSVTPTLTPSTSPSSPIPQNGLVAWYDASNVLSYSGSGSNWYDISTNAATGTIVNSPTFNSGTKLFSFTGSQYVTIPTFLNESDATYTLFVVLQSNNAGQLAGIFGQATEANGRRAHLLQLTATFGFNGYSNDKQDVSGPYAGIPVVASELKSLAVAMNTAASPQTDACGLFLNGSLITRGDTGSGASNLNVGTTGAAIASFIDLSYKFNGDIGVCMAWDRTLSDAEILQVHNYYSSIYTFLPLVTPTPTPTSSGSVPTPTPTQTITPTSSVTPTPTITPSTSPTSVYLLLPCCGGSSIYVTFSPGLTPVLGKTYYMTFVGGAVTSNCYQVFTLGGSPSGIVVNSLGTQYNTCTPCVIDNPCS